MGHLSQGLDYVLAPMTHGLRHPSSVCKNYTLARVTISVVSTSFEVAAN